MSVVWFAFTVWCALISSIAFCLSGLTNTHVKLHMFLCVSVCVSCIMCMYIHIHVCVCCVRACVRVCVRECVCPCVSVFSWSCVLNVQFCNHNTNFFNYNNLIIILWY